MAVTLTAAALVAAVAVVAAAAVAAIFNTHFFPSIGNSKDLQDTVEIPIPARVYAGASAGVVGDRLVVGRVSKSYPFRTGGLSC